MNLYYKNIPSDTLFDYEEFYDRIATGIPNGSTLVEVGIADGRSLVYLASKLDYLGKDYKLYGVDNFAYGGDYQRNVVTNHLIASGVKNVEIIGLSSLDASCKFNDGALQFVYIDASHEYQNTKADILLWERKLVDGGYLAGHDYHSEENEGVGRAVREMIPADRLRTENTEKGHGLWWTIKEPIVSISEINERSRKKEEELHLLLEEKDRRIEELNNRIISLLNTTRN